MKERSSQGSRSCPGGHSGSCAVGVQARAPASDFRPLEHAVHVVPPTAHAPHALPAVASYVSAGHAVHVASQAELPGPHVPVPAGHVVHSTAPPREYCPTKHGVQAVAASPDHVPGGHDVHTSSPSTALYLPAEQIVQSPGCVSH